MIRRAFLGCGLMLVGLTRRAWAQLPNIRYAPLSRPVRIPAEQVATAWHMAPFTAEAMAPSGAAAGRRVLISGVLFRRSAPDDRVSATAGGIGASGSMEELSALCLTCPHEQCQVDLISDPAQLLKITGRYDHHPIFECGCHASVFDALDDGARIAGETPRGLYRFRIAGVRDGTVEINEVEADALTEV
jgi:nitrite reductase/ring-hydroxylating ferredoxin subunit